MPLVFQEIQNLGDGSQPDLIHFSDNEAHILYTNDGRLYLQTATPTTGDWNERALTEELDISLDDNMDYFSIDKLDGFGGVGSYAVPQSQYLLLYGTETPEKVSYETIITSIEHAYDDNQLNITISNKAYLNDDLNYLTALWAKSDKSTRYVDNKSDNWNDAKTKADEANEFINSPINVNDNVINIEQRDEFDQLIQQAQITRRGIYMRDADNANGQMKIFSDKIVFTNDNWATYSVAIDSSGITTSGSFILRSDNQYGGYNLVSIDGNGISIYGSETEGNGIEIFNILNERTFYLDTAGNANFTGIITGGTFQTAVSGERIVITENDFTSYNSDGVLQGLCFGASYGTLFGDVSFYADGEEALNIFGNKATNETGFVAIGGYNLVLGTYGGETQPAGDWDFGGAGTISGLETDDEADHDHNISNGTKLAVVDEFLTITGYVTFNDDGGHYHAVKKA